MAGPSRVRRSCESGRAVVRPPRAVVPWWGMPGTRLPMFPLSAVLFPHASMPLHVFEPRYRELLRDCLAGDARFGIVLIERGSEVGGGDERSDSGTRGVITQVGRAARRALGPRDRGGGPDRGRGVAARRPLSGGAGARRRAGAGPWPIRRATPARWWAPPGSGSAGPAPCWPSRAGRRRWPPSSPSTAVATPSVAAWQLCAVAPLNAYDAQRPAGGRRRPGAPAPPGRVDGGARARPAPHAARRMSARRMRGVACTAEPEPPSRSREKRAVTGAPGARAGATSSSSPPTSSATTASAATGARWPARRSSTAWPPRASTTAGPTTRTRCACRRARPCSRASTCGPTAWWPTASRCRSTRPSVAQYLHDAAGYRTALLGKAHFEPGFDPTNQCEENARVARGDTGPWRGFERAEQAMHAAAWGDHPIAHYGRWLKANHPEHLHSFAGLLQAEPGGDTAGAGDEEQPDPAGVVPHRLGGRPDRRLAVLARRRRAVVLLDVVPRPAPPVGPAGLRAGPGAVAGPRPAARAPRLRRGDPRRPGAQAGALARLSGTARFSNMEGGPAIVRPLAPHPRPDPRGQRQGARDERADRRGVRPRAADGRRSGVGWPTPTSSSPPTTARCRATSASSTRGRTTPTR